MISRSSEHSRAHLEQDGHYDNAVLVSSGGAEIRVLLIVMYQMQL